MSFIKNILLKIGTGFLYGAGFSIAFIIISSFSFSYFLDRPKETEIERTEYVETRKSEREKIFKNYDESAKLITEVKKENISENEFTLIGSLRNEGDSNWSYIKLKAEIFNKNGEFIDQCSEFITEKSSPGSSINFKLSCGNCSKFTLEGYDSYKLSITGASFERE